MPRQEAPSDGGGGRPRPLLGIMSLVLLALLVAVPVGAWLLGGGDEEPAPGTSERVTAVTYPPGTPAPPLRLPALDGGGTVDLGALRGRPVVVNFWASWCAPCEREMPLLRAAARRYEDRGLAVVGVLVNDEPEPARAFLRRHRATWPVAVDEDGRAVTEFGVVGLPETFFVRRDGTLASRQLGELSRTSLQRQLRTVLAS